MSFKREDRYVVIKFACLTPGQRERLKGFLGDWRIPHDIKQEDAPDMAKLELRIIAMNPALAAPYGEADNGIMQFDDPYQAMAFAMWRNTED